MARRLVEQVNSRMATERDGWHGRSRVSPSLPSGRRGMACVECMPPSTLCAHHERLLWQGSRGRCASDHGAQHALQFVDERAHQQSVPTDRRGRKNLRGDVVGLWHGQGS